MLHLNAFSPAECRQILGATLWKLDRADSTCRRKRRKGAQGAAADQDDANLQDLFSGPYGFEEGHFDSVIHDYRESLLSSFPPPSTAYPDLPALMRRLYTLVLPQLGIDAELPPNGTLTHVLHLAPHGQILPHVDNLDASGSVILGVSLGASRVLRLEHKDAKTGWDVLLPSGSVYLQKDSVRYSYEHSILPYDHEGSVWDGRRLEPGHRVSIMIRVSWVPLLRAPKLMTRMPLEDLHSCEALMFMHGDDVVVARRSYMFVLVVCLLTLRICSRPTLDYLFDVVTCCGSGEQGDGRRNGRIARNQRPPYCRTHQRCRARRSALVPIIHSIPDPHTAQAHCTRDGETGEDRWHRAVSCICADTSYQRGATHRCYWFM